MRPFSVMTSAASRSCLEASIAGFPASPENLELHLRRITPPSTGNVGASGTISALAYVNAIIVLSIDQSGLDQTVGLIRYRRHKPEETSLYPIVEQHLPRFLSHLAEHGTQLPPFVTQEFGDYLACGRLEYGFLRVKCDGCRHEHLVTFSCKSRGSFGSMQDVTELVELEEQLLQAQELQTIGQLAGGGAHDFNNRRDSAKSLFLGECDESLQPLKIRVRDPHRIHKTARSIE